MGFRLRLVGLLLLAADAAVGAATEAGNRVDFVLASGDEGLASFFNSFVLGEDGPRRGPPGLCVFIEVRLVSLGSVGYFFAFSDEAPSFADSATAIGFAGDPLVMGFSILGDTGVLGVLGEVGDLPRGFGGGIRRVGGELIGFAPSVVLSFTAGGGPKWFEETASFILLPIDFGVFPGVGLPFIPDAERFSISDVGDLGDSLAPVSSFDLEVGGEVSNSEPFKMLPSPACVFSSAAFCWGSGSGSLCTPFNCESEFDGLPAPFIKGPSSISRLMSAMAITSLIFLNPQCCPSSVSPGLATATKLARTLLTGRLCIDASE